MKAKKEVGYYEKVKDKQDIRYRKHHTDDSICDKSYPRLYHL